MRDDFYFAFQERYRGSRELIKSRLRVYLPFMDPLFTCFAEVKAVDLGCGRGEWLELLLASGFDVQGVDLDRDMTVACRERGLNAQLGEAVTFLKQLPRDSQTVVSGFHLVEHISFADLQTLVAEALRVLVPGGLLILETPNPENIVVGSASFYLDPTHTRPIPSQLLSFLPEYYGFARTKILRLHESAELPGRSPTLFDVLNGASPDYAIVAQKGTAPEQMRLFDGPFRRDYGLSLEHLAKRYDIRLSTIETRIQQAEIRARQAEEELALVTGSLSWRVTKPLRMIAPGLRRMVKPLVATVVRPVVSIVLNNPRIASPVKRVLKKVPFVMPVAKRLVYDSFSVPPIASAELLPRFNRERDAGELSVDTLLARIRSELTKAGKEQGL